MHRARFDFGPSIDYIMQPRICVPLCVVALSVLAFDSELFWVRCVPDSRCVLEKGRLFVVLDGYRFVLILGGLDSALKLLEAVALELLRSVEVGVLYGVVRREVKHVVLGCIRDRFGTADILLINSQHHLAIVAVSRALLHHLLNPFCLADPINTKLGMGLRRGEITGCQGVVADDKLVKLRDKLGIFCASRELVETVQDFLSCMRHLIGSNSTRVSR